MPNRKLLLVRLPTWNGTGGVGRGARKMGGRCYCQAKTYRQIVRSASRQVGKATDSEWRVASSKCFGGSGSCPTV
jgi:hypothetical protein